MCTYVHKELIWSFFLIWFICCFCTNLYSIRRFCFGACCYCCFAAVYFRRFFIPVCIDALNEVLQKSLVLVRNVGAFCFFLEQYDDHDVHVKCIAQIIMFAVAFFCRLALHIMCSRCVSFAAFSAVYDFLLLPNTHTYVRTATCMHLHEHKHTRGVLMLAICLCCCFC